ncbi:hypothetical protein [Flavobacterium sp. XGLA_31]|uniref:hypothetical protein n=1 Tax=Flavobacterium sp. XGLA_31 TaxID=3447666 RepID=UPI003F309B6A
MRMFYFIGCIGLSIFLVHSTGIMAEQFFQINNQITYLGVLIGFALTLYTFGLSILKDIYEAIEKISFTKIENKEEVYKSLKDAFDEIKSDIFLIFVCIIFLFINSIIANTINPFNWNVEYLKIPDIMSVSVFLLSSFALLDIMKALFGLSKLIFKD